MSEASSDKKPSTNDLEENLRRQRAAEARPFQDARHAAEERARQHFLDLNCGTPPPYPGKPAAVGVIEVKIRDLRREADELQALLNALPRTMPTAADVALWRLLQKNGDCA